MQRSNEHVMHGTVPLHHPSLLHLATHLPQALIVPRLLTVNSTQKLIAKAGGIQSLIALLAIKNYDVQAQGASALAQLTRNNAENQNSLTLSGGLPQLVGLLTSNSLHVQRMAALALAEACRENPGNQTEASELGCITSLVDQAKGTSSPAGSSGSGHDEVEQLKAEAVGAIWVLSDRHEDNKKEVARRGGLQPVVGILAAGTRRGKQHAAYALSSLASENVENQREITALLVSLLSSGSDAAKAEASASLWRLVEENQSTQEEIAKAVRASAALRHG
jgi:hypothetical protein